MKKRIKEMAFLWMMLLVLFTSKAQSTIVQAEYFIDDEPGIGLGTSLPITSEGTIDFDFNLDVSNLDLGIHTLYLRTKQDNGLWSVPSVRFFYVIDPASRVYEPLDLNMVGAEYFIDTDPGPGNGVKIQVGTSKTADQNLAVTIADQEPGLHFLYLRTVQDDGMWSAAKPVPFYVFDSQTDDLLVFQTDLIAAEYFFDEDPGPGKGQLLPLQKGASLDSRPWAASTVGLSEGRHYLNIRVQSEGGFWNVIRSEEIFIYESECSLPVADFSFDTVSINTPINLVDLSTNVTDTEFVKYEWDVMGDGSIESTEVDFDLSFEEKGVYPVKLTVTNEEGCFTSKVRDVYITDGFPNELALSANDSLFVGEEITLTAPEGYSYLWNTEETSSSIVVTESGNYFAWLTADGITYKSKSVLINFFKPFSAELDAHDATSGKSNGAASLEIAETGGLPFEITWSTGDEELTSLNDLSEGSYSVEVKTPLATYDYPFTIGSIGTPTAGILAAEYFFASDPGPGKAISINIYQSDDIKYRLAPDISGLTAGMHEIYIRTKQASGLWGFATKKVFYVIEASDANPVFSFGGDIVYAEYAIDDNPALGTGTPIALTASGQLISETLSLDVSALSAGEHTMNIRVKDSDGNWSFEKPYNFQLCTAVPLALEVKDTTICVGSSVTIVVEAAGEKVNWYDADMNVLKSSTDQFIDLEGAENAADYFVSQSNAEGCEGPLSSFTVAVDHPEIYAGIDLGFITTDDSYQLDGMIPEGGLWSGGNYVTEEGLFSPSIAGGGTFELTYSIDTFNCTVIDKRTIVVEKVEQQIEITDLPSTLSYDQLPYTFDAVASSELPVSAQILSGDGTMNQLTLSASSLGVFEIVFEQVGDKIYLSETLEPISIELLKGLASISVENTTVVGDDTPKPITAITEPAGLTYTVTYDGSTDAPSAVGSYDVVVTIDDPLYEGTISFTYVIADPLPDLTFGSVTLAKADIRITETLDVSGTIRNIGLADLSDDFVLEYWVSSDQLLDANDVSIKSSTLTETVAEGATLSFSENLVLGSDLDAGDYFLIIQIDPDSQLTELDSDNNLEIVIFSILPNEAPQMVDQTFSIAENSTNNTSIGTFVASDVDSNTLTFSITSGNESGAFALSATGVLTVADGSKLDFETLSSYSLVVEVSDGELTASATITVNVTDVDESVNQAPQISDQTFSIAENSANDTSIGTVVASDVDSNNLTFSITSGNASGAFALSASGALTVADGSKLDFETLTSYSLVVEVSDGELTASATVTVNVTDVDETLNQAPEIADQTFTIEENSANGTVVGTILATDADPLTFSILSGNDNGVFELSESGELTVSNSSLLDFEIKEQYILTVEVTDGSLRALAIVTVSLIDVEEALSVDDLTDFKVYPNPTNDVVMIASADPILSVCLLDLSGNIQKMDFNSASDRISLAHLSQGTYMLTIKTKDQTITQRIIRR